jgi:hypothetical protein
MTTLAVAYTTQNFPVGTGPVASIVASLTGAIAANSQSLAIPLAATSVSAALNPDTYSYSITNLDPSGNTLGQAFTGSFTVAAPATVSLSLASGLTVSGP